MGKKNQPAAPITSSQMKQIKKIISPSISLKGKVKYTKRHSSEKKKRTNRFIISTMLTTHLWLKKIEIHGFTLIATKLVPIRCFTFHKNHLDTFIALLTWHAP